MSPVTGILLAAGLSRRYGSNKLLQPLSDQLPLVLHTARRLQAVLPDSLAVVAAGDHRTAELLVAQGLRIVTNPRPEAGMGHSIARAVGTARKARGWLIALADMPWIDPATLQAVVTALQQPEDIVAPFYDERRGHPVGFGAHYGEALMALDGDEGAHAILNANARQLKPVAVNDPGVLQDVDQPQDLAPQYRPYKIGRGDGFA